MKKVGIIYSPGFGAEWSSWGDPLSALDQELAAAIQAEKPQEDLLRIAEKNWPGEYVGGLDQAKVQWVDEGVQFFIDEYDGNESVVLREDGELWIIAKEAVK